MTKRYRGTCLCHGVYVEGTPARSRPEPYWASRDPFGGGPRVRVRLLVDARGQAHDVPTEETTQ